MAISLEKNQKISLAKGGANLQNLCIGVNWGAIEKKGFFGPKKEAVDLDASVGLFDKSGNLISSVYYGNLEVPGVRHSGDDLTGDMDGDDGLDNEVIQIYLNGISPKVSRLGFVLNSFSGQDFKDIPFASIRIYEGTPDRVDNVIATFDIANDSSFSGVVSMIMGQVYREGDTWKFQSIGEATKDRKLKDTLNTFSKKYA